VYYIDYFINKYDERKLVGTKGNHPLRLSYYKFSDSEKYCKGKVEKHVKLSYIEKLSGR
jgi:hypothetical protein